MAFKSLVSVNGHPLPEPAPGGYQVNVATIVDSARNLQGYMVGGVIRDDVIKISLSWNFLYPQQWAYVLSLFNSAQGGGFENYVEFYNPSIAAWETRQMYVSDRTDNGMILRDKETGEPLGWEDPKLSLIQV